MCRLKVRTAYGCVWTAYILVFIDWSAALPNFVQLKNLDATAVLLAMFVFSNIGCVIEAFGAQA